MVKLNYRFREKDSLFTSRMKTNFSAVESRRITEIWREKKMHKSSNTTYRSEIITALEQLGGAASLKEINDTIEKNGNLPNVSSNRNWRNNVSAEIQRHCSSCLSYNGAEDLFYPVYGLGEGYWGLNSYKEKTSYTELNPIEQRQIESIKKDANLSVTQKEQIILARCGQGKFRSDLIEKYKVCIITGIENPKLLTASHIKPWRVSTDSERLDKNNGLLLSALYDKMFDVGLITFTTDGRIIVSAQLSNHDKAIINIDTSHKYISDICQELRINLEYHNDAVFQK